MRCRKASSYRYLAVARKADLVSGGTIPPQQRPHQLGFREKQRDSLADDLHQHPLAPPAVEFAVEDLLPRAKVQPPPGHGDDDLAAHHLPFEVRVAVVLAGAVVTVTADRFVRGQVLEPRFVVGVQTGFIIVDEDRCSYVC